MKAMLFISGLLFFLPGKSQIKADSIFIYYGMTQQAPEAPLMDYIENLETSGAKILKINDEYYAKINAAFASVKPKKYKGNKHSGTVYFAVVFKDGNKQFGAFDSSLEAGSFINLSSGQIWALSDDSVIDNLYYTLLQIH